MMCLCQQLWAVSWRTSLRTAKNKWMHKIVDDSHFIILFLIHTLIIAYDTLEAF